jgi:Uma2 family endonuclease
VSISPPESSIGEPAWEIAQLFPAQGMWSESDYLELDTGRLVEYVDGRIEVLPVPTELHQLIVGYLYRTLFAFVESRNLGTVLFAPLRIKLWEGRFREPDIVFMTQENQQRRGKQFWTGTDLAIEVVSEDDPNRDHVVKRQEYERALVREYWVVDPFQQTITVMTLNQSDQTYSVVGKFRSGEKFESSLLAGLTVHVDEVFSVSGD